MRREDGNGWEDYKKLIMQQLDDLKVSLKDVEDRIKDIREIDVPSIRVEIGLLKLKAGIWGAVSGLVSGIGYLLLRRQ